MGFFAGDETVFDVAVDEGGFAYALRAEDYEFGFEGGWNRHLCLESGGGVSSVY